MGGLSRVTQPLTRLVVRPLSKACSRCARQQQPRGYSAKGARLSHQSNAIDCGCRMCARRRERSRAAGAARAKDTGADVTHDCVDFSFLRVQFYSLNQGGCAPPSHLTPLPPARDRPVSVTGGETEGTARSRVTREPDVARTSTRRAGGPLLVERGASLRVTAACTVARDAGVCAMLGAVPAPVPMRVVHEASCVSSWRVREARSCIL
jgi:hypothetical protein